MKRSRSLRSMVFFLAVMLVIPIVCFALFLQFQTWRTMQNNLQRELDGELATANHMLQMIIDKYDMVLFDFCTDDEIIELVEEINESEKATDAVKYQIRRSLAHICNRNSGIEGITLVTESGTVCFYDRRAASFVSTKWANRIAVPDMTDKMAVYQGSQYMPDSETGSVHMLQLTRRLADYRNINRNIGTVILSIDQSVLWNDLQISPNSTLYVCEGDQIIAAPDPDQIGSSVSLKPHKGFRVRSVDNAKTGWKVYHFYSMASYRRSSRNNICIGLGSLLLLMMFSTVILHVMTSQVLDQVGQLVYAMSEIENGNFSVQIPNVSSQQNEIERIAAGFNEMSGQLNRLVETVKQSTVDQKNAELQAMEAQIDPHFLYNTLDTINWKALEHDDYEVSGMVGALADILRYSIRNPGDMVSIGQELSWLDRYIMLQKEKLEQPLVVDTDVPEELMGYRIHKLILQPFVENAINHGFHRMKEACRISITMKLFESQLYIRIRDNGCGIPPEIVRELNDKNSSAGHHVGVANVRKRLELYYGEEHDMYFESREGSGTSVHLFIRAVSGGGQNEDHNSGR